MVIRLVPSPAGSAVRTACGVLHLPGLRLEIEPARPRLGRPTVSGPSPGGPSPGGPSPGRPSPSKPSPSKPSVAAAAAGGPDG
jgi:hypothetical protein